MEYPFTRFPRLSKDFLILLIKISLIYMKNLNRIEAETMKAECSVERILYFLISQQVSHLYHLASCFILELASTCIIDINQSMFAIDKF